MAGLITSDDIIIVDSLTLWCPDCGHIYVDGGGDDENDTAMSVREAWDITAQHVKDIHK